MNRPLITPSLSTPYKKPMVKALRGWFLRLKKAFATLPVATSRKITLLLGLSMAFLAGVVIYYLFFMAIEDDDDDDESDEFSISQRYQRLVEIEKEMERHLPDNHQLQQQIQQELQEPEHHEHDNDEGEDSDSDSDDYEDSIMMKLDEANPRDPLELVGRDALNDTRSGSLSKRKKLRKSIKKLRKKQHEIRVKARDKIKQHWDRLKESYKRVQERDAEMRNDVHRARTDADAKFEEQFQRFESM